MTTPRKRQWRKLSAEIRAGIENGGKIEAVAAKTAVIKPVVKETLVTKTVAKTATKISSTKTATKTTTVKTATTKAKKTSN